MSAEPIPPLSVVEALRHLRRWCASHLPGTEPRPVYPLLKGGCMRTRLAVKNRTDIPVQPLRWTIERFDASGKRQHSYPAVKPLREGPARRPGKKTKTMNRTELLDLLRTLEWRGCEAADHIACPCCSTPQGQPHQETCQLAIAIRAHRQT